MKLKKLLNEFIMAGGFVGGVPAIGDMYRPSWENKRKPFLRENFGTELNKIVSVFRQVEKNMRGTSVSDPRDIWIALGIELRLINETLADQIRRRL